jgi:uncharacterized membrane protein YcaP (DUF421 family)
MRAALALVSFVVMFHPDVNVSLMVAVIVVPATLYGVIRHRRIAPPKDELQSQPVIIIDDGEFFLRYRHR